MRRRISLYTLGCKVNQYDSAALKRALTAREFQVVEAGGRADVLVVNTCTVTSATDRQNRQLIRKLRRANPGALLVATGCQAEVFPEALKTMPEVDLVVGNRQKGALAQKIAQALDGDGMPSPGSHTSSSLWETGADDLPGHTRAFLQVQDGCQAFCTYCIVPYARGPSRSRPLDSIMSELHRMEEVGIQEVVLTGIHLGLYGKDLQPASSLVALLDRVLDGCAIPRVRLSSIEPLEVDDLLLDRMETFERICPHLHVPLQSGDDEVLRWMNRPYGTRQYRERVLKAMSEVPDLTLGCDVIVGFPGETEGHFQNTLRFLEDLPCTYLHVFPFSPRPGTPAYHYTGRISPREIKARSQTLRAFSQRRRIMAMDAQVGRSLPVLMERPWRGGDGWMEGLTAQYLRVRVPAGNDLRNRIVRVRMESVHGSHLVGRCMEEAIG